MNEISEMLRKAREKNPERVQRLIDGLLSSDKRQEELDKLNNQEIAHLVMTKLWAESDLWTEESDILEQVIDRLMNK